MNIVVISKYAPVPGYGSNPRWFELGKRISAQGHCFEIITSDSNHGSNFRVCKGRMTTFEIDLVKFTVIKTLKYKKTASVRRVLSWFDFDYRLFRYKRYISPDVVIISSLSLTSILFGLYLKFFKKAKLVFEIRDIWPLTLIEEGRYSRFHPLYCFLRLIEICGYKNADLIVGTMPNLKQHVIDSRIRKSDKCFHSCGIGVDPDRAKPVPKYKFSALVEDKIKYKKIIGYCGSIGLTNNLHSFIRYIKCTSAPDVYFIIAGDGAERTVYEKELSKAENVMFLGHIEPKDVQRFLRRCDILFLATMPSRVWEYGQSMNKVVDYMLAAKFIIAQYEGFSSMIDEADCGLFTTGERLHECLDYALKLSADERNKRGINGRRWILRHQNYDYLSEQYMDKIKQIYKMAT